MAWGKRARVTLDQRFFAKVAMTDGCWMWLGALTSGGYGNLWVNGRYRPAHVVLYEQVVGSVPDGLELDHLCRNRGCVRPDHLEAVTRAENLMRSPVAPSAVNARKTHCSKAGHELAGRNLRTDRKTGWRTCVACRREWKRHDYWRKKEAMA